MEEIKGIEWFKEHVAPRLLSYDLSYRFFENGDLGSLNQVEFNSAQKGGNIDFWGLGFLGVFIRDYRAKKQVMNVLLESPNENEVEMTFLALFEHLDC